MRRVLGVLLFVLVFAPMRAVMQPQNAPYEQDFIVTAYYSPLPDQCCYVRGGETADKLLNGQGVRGADGTAVYPGMLAAPPGYVFGTRIALPGIGIGTVHDRGGAIRELQDAHRLDLWVGEGEEGLARALAFGVQHVRGTVYPLTSAQPAERMVLDQLPSPPERLQPFLSVDYGLLDVRPAAGDIGLSVTLLQKGLHDAGFYDGPVTGKFGNQTQVALTAFIRAMDLREPANHLTQRTAAYLMAAAVVQKSPTEIPIVNARSSVSDIQTAQRLLRYIGFYRGRTDGTYDTSLQKAILTFQQERKLVGTKDDPGAGRIGPLTRKSLTNIWERKLIAARAGRLMLLDRVRRTLAKGGQLPDRFLTLGMSGNAIRQLQEMLSERGFFPAEKINGAFGPLTQSATIDYQLSAGLIRRASDQGAGSVGPATLRALRKEEVREAYRLVRGFGWKAL